MQKFPVDPNIAKAKTIHTDFYTSQAMFEDCKEKIFANSWQYIGSKQTLNSNNLETVLDDVGIFSLTVALTATNDDVYIPKIAQRAGFGGVMGISYVTQDQTTGKATALGKASASLTSSAQVSGNFYKIVEGTTENFTVTVNYDPAAAGTFKVQLVNVFFNTKPVNPDVNNFSNNILLPKPNGFDRGYYSEALVI